MLMQMREGKQNFKMVGFLSNRDNLYVNKNGQLALKIDLCTDWPESLYDISQIPDKMKIFVNNNNKIGYVDDESDPSDENRIDNAYEFFKNKWLITTPNFSYDEEKSRIYATGYDVESLPQNSTTNPDEIKFIRLPVFRIVNGNNRPNNRFEFENALVKGKVVGNVEPWTDSGVDVPQAVIWQETDTELSIYTDIEKQEKVFNGFMYYPKDGDTIKKVEISSKNIDWLENFLILSSEDVAYIPIDIFEAYRKLAVNFEIDPSSEVHPENAVAESENALISTNTDEKQIRFVQKFFEQTEYLGLHYNLKDLINFHTAMASNGLVILSGLSGTGKSKLVSAYAMALGLVDVKNSLTSQLCFIPVRPFWADDSDLLGYADLVNNVYRPGDSGLIDTLLEANKNPQKLYIVVFDEMNLAKVEHYFSQFLSVLEMQPNDRYIQLYNTKLENRLYNKENYPSQIKIGENVLFVGTVNTDESTFQFSDKVLDRSNVISLHVVPFYTDFNSKSIEKPNISQISTSDYRNMVDNNKNEPLTKAEKSLLWDIHQILNSADRNLGIGWRIVQQISSFLECLPNIDDGVSRGEAFDLQIVQRVLTKIRGSEEQLHDFFEIGDGEPGKLIQILDKYSNIAEFKESRDVIKQKAQELKLYGFTM